MFQLLLFFSFIVISLNEILLVSSSTNCSAGFHLRYPFGDPLKFGDNGYPALALKYLDNRIVINVSDHLYRVQCIDHNRKLVTVVDVDIAEPDCPQPRRNVSLQSTPYLHLDSSTANMTIFYNCTNNTRTPTVEQLLPCLDRYNNNNRNERSYAFTLNNISEGFNLYKTCSESVVVHYNYDFFNSSGYNTKNFTQALKLGFGLRWSTPVECLDCENSGGQCSYSTTTGVPLCNCDNGITAVICPHSRSKTTLMVIIGVSTGVGGVVLLILLVLYSKIISSLCSCLRNKTESSKTVEAVFLENYMRIISLLCSCWRNKAESSTNLDVFLENYGCLGLQRYKYSDVKKMTNSFKNTLGKGGYGCVFKGQLRDGRLVAVKVLNESKGKGEDFVNEVATIGRTNHVNVVSLLGFCTEKTKRALVYEYKPNGSLEQFIYKDKESSITPPLGWEKLYQIALGIARGLVYLHRGCNTRILHLDIKPHNILLDEDFCPKISDFGMAKLCPTRDISILSWFGARGTPGYIALEVSFKNFGGVSHKSDVYSYGMMVLEMIGGRKNIDATVENMSEIYFPQWIYNHLKPDFNIEGSSQMFEEETTKKMIIVALWCIQTHPTNRPSMSKVVEMLERNNEELQMPPNPSHSSSVLS